MLQAQEPLQDRLEELFQLGGHPSLAAATIRTGVQDRWQDGEASREWRGETHDGYF